MAIRRERADRKPLRTAMIELESHLGEIFTVKEWADHMGYSRYYFSRKVKKKFGKSPKDLLTEMKLQKVKQQIQEDPEAIGYHIATEVGFPNERSLYKFLAIKIGLTLSSLQDLLL